MGSSVVATLFVLLIILVCFGLFIFWHIRNLLREAKSYERGLKMVPLLIHLPPSSDERDYKGRDPREVADENISKAQVLYNIIAGTAKKGFKSKFYGERHISFEIVAHKGRVHFYTAVPVAMVSVIEQAVLSAYPNSRLEEVAEHNIFSPVGKISGTTGGELILKEPYIYPIATYLDLKRDSMQALLNSLAKLDKEDGAGLQILLRPANRGWTKVATKEAQKIREGKKSKKGADMAFWWLRQVFIAPVKAPEAKDKEVGEKIDKPASNVEQTLAESIEEKTTHPGYEVLIRVVASSNISNKAQTILSNLVSSFSLFDAPGKNGFKFVPAKDIEHFVTAYILRFFPPEQNKNILNDVEIATIFHLPDSSNTPTTQLERQQSKQVDGPRNVADEGILMGYNIFRGIKKPIRLSLEDRRRHTYIIGETGTGKSTFLENIALQDMLEGRGFAFVDPHGDVVEKLMGMVPKERTEDVIYFNPSDMDYPFGLNLFDFKRQEEKDFLIQETINILYSLYDPNRQGFIGARFEQIFRNSALLLMADPAGGTFIDVPKTLVDPDFVRQKLKYVTDQNLLDYWTKEWPNAQRSNDAGEVTSWVASKFGAFLGNTMMRNIIGQNKSSFDLRDIMDNKKILLVNLSKGLTGELNAKLLGMIFVMKFQAAAMSRADMPESERQDFSLYVDEFQNFSTESFATILSEARKYHLNLIVANQYIGQLSEEVRDAVLGNVGTAISFRVGNESAEVMAKYMSPIFDESDLRQIPNGNVVVRMLIKGVPTQPFSMAGLPPLGSFNKQLAAALKQLSAAKYGKPKAVVEQEIFARMKTIPQPKPSFGGIGAGNQNPFGGGASASFGGLGTGMPAGPKATGQASFLDEWLAKRKAATASIGSSPTTLDKTKTVQSDTSANQADSKTPDLSANNKYTSDDKPTNNISSDSLDLKEVESIADELKESVKKPEPDVVAEDSANIAKKSTDGVFEHNDTIHIDNDGNIDFK